MFASFTETFMAPSSPKDVGSFRSGLRSTNSFPREASSMSFTANRAQRASSLQNGGPAAMASNRQPSQGVEPHTTEEPDTFEVTPAEDPPEPTRASVDLDDLPIELIGLTDG